MPEIFVAKREAFEAGGRRIVSSARGEIGVFEHEGAFYAYANICPHSGGPACEGVMMPRVIDVIAEDKTYQGQVFSEEDMHFVCPWHGYEYDLRTGVCAGDNRLKLKKYEVVERDDALYVIA